MKAASSATVADSLLLERHAVHVGLAQLEAGALVEAVRGLARGARGEVDGAGADLLGVLNGGDNEGLAGTLAAGALVDDDVLDPRAHARGDLEGGQRQHAEDRVVALRVSGVGAEHEEVHAGLGEEALHVGLAHGGGGAGELGDQAPHGLVDFGRGGGDEFDGHVSPNVRSNCNGTGQ